MRRLLGAVGFVILCHTGPAPSQQARPAQLLRTGPEQGKPNQTKQSTGPDQRGTKDAPIFVEGLITTKPSETETDREARDAKEKAANDKVTIQVNAAIAFLTGLMFLVALAQAYLFWRQLRYMRDSLNDTRIASQAALVSADAAKEGVVLAKQAARKQLRAYVNVGIAQASFEENEGHMWALVELKNYGQTPAYEVTGWIALQLKSDHYQPSFPDRDIEQAVSIVPPGIPTYYRVPSTDKVTAAQRQAIIDSKATAFVHGMVTYRDVFGDLHYTRYRLFLRGDGAAEGRFKPSTTGNETDDFPQPG